MVKSSRIVNQGKSKVFPFTNVLIRTSVLLLETIFCSFLVCRFLLAIKWTLSLEKL